MSKKQKNIKTSFFDKIVNNSGQSYLVFGLLAIAVFAQSIGFNFTYHDDLGLINSKGLSLGNISLIFKKGVFYFTGDVKADADIYYRPLQNIVYAIGNVVGGRTAPVHHVIILLLHIVASCLLFNFFITIGYKRVIAFLATIVFTLHPLLVQAVAWIPGVGELLITIFLLLSFIYMHRFLKDDITNLLYLGLSQVFFLLALLSKESAVGFIPVVLFYILFVNKNKEGLYKKLSFYIAGLVAFSIVWYLLRQNAIGKYSPVTIAAVVDSLARNGKLIVFYIAKIFLPFNLSPLLSPADAGVVPGIIVLVILIGAFFIIKGKRNLRLMVWGIVWYLFFLLPTLYVGKSSYEFYAYGHRLYLPIIGFLIAVMEIFAFNEKEYSKPVLYTSFGIPALVFFFLSFNYCKAFKDKYAFNQTTIDNSPHALVSFKALGAIYLEEKDCAKALDLYTRAVALDPTNGALVGLVANTYSGCLGDIPHAIEWYNKSFAIDSTGKVAANTAISMGNIYNMSLHNAPLAQRWYKKAVRLDTTQSFPSSMLGNIYLPVNPDSAAYWYRKALKADATTSSALNGLGLINYNQKNYATALTYFKKAYPYDSTDIQLLKNIVLSSQQSGDVASAKRYADIYKLRGGAIDDFMSQYFR